MALFPSRMVKLNFYTGTAAFGNTIQFALPRTFFGDSALLQIPITITTPVAAATFSTPGFAALIKNISLQISDGTANRTQTYASGWGLLRKGVRVLDQLDGQTLGLLGASLTAQQSTNTSTNTIVPGTYILTIPLLWRTTQVSDPNGSSTLLPLPRYNTNPTLSIQFGALSDVITSATGGWSVAIGSPNIALIQREILNIAFPVFDTQLAEETVAQGGAASSVIKNLPVPGNYTMINMYASNPNTFVGFNPQAAGNPWNLKFIGQDLRQFDLYDLKIMEQYTQASLEVFQNFANTGTTLNDMWAGVYHLNFLNDNFGAEAAEFGSVLNSNVLSGTGSLVELNQNFSAACNMSYVYEQILGTITSLTFAGAMAEV